MRATAGRAVLLLLAAGYTGLQVWGRVGGSSAQERRRALPGDALIVDPSVVTDHAVTIAATPEEIWPWLTQMGWHRAGWYTPRWVDRVLFPANWPSLDHLDPTMLRDLAVGDTFPDGAPGTAFFRVEEVAAPRRLVLHSTTHLPASWSQRFGARIDWTWAFALTERPQGGTRVHLRVRGRTRPWWLTAAYVGVLVPADGIMGPGMLHGVRRRVEARPREKAPGRPSRTVPTRGVGSSAQPELAPMPGRRRQRLRLRRSASPGWPVQTWTR